MPLRGGSFSIVSRSSRIKSTWTACFGLRGTSKRIEDRELEDQITLANAMVGGTVAVVNKGEAILLRITEIEEEEFMTGHPMHVPMEDRYGKTSRRPWTTDEELIITIMWSDILCSVALDETRCLDHPSLERLRRLGVEMDGENTSPY